MFGRGLLTEPIVIHREGREERNDSKDTAREYKRTLIHADKRRDRF
jgi:hypothetical protein